MGVPDASGTVVSRPYPPFQNLPIDADFYQPSRYVIENITLGITTLVTTTEDHNYVIGQLCRLVVPGSFGTYQLNEQSGYVISIPDTDQVELDINSLQYDAFVSSDATTLPQIMAIGDINYGQINTGRTNNLTYIPGSFIDISPV